MQLLEQEYDKVKVPVEEMDPRSRALVLFLFSTGCRRGEVSELKLEDVNLGERAAVIKGMSSRFRTVYFSEDCAVALKEYLQTRTPNDSGYLFVKKDGEKA